MWGPAKILGGAGKLGGVALRNLFVGNPGGRGGWYKAGRAATRTLGIAGIIGASVYGETMNRTKNRLPSTYTSRGFGAGFGQFGGRMPFDGGIGATGSLVLNSSTHGRF